MVCESEPDAPWGLLIMTSVREAQTDRRRDVKGCSGSSGMFQLAMLYPTLSSGPYEGGDDAILSRVYDVALPSH